MPSSVEVDQVWECTFCGTQFVDGVADGGPNGEPRCPQCLICDARPVSGDEIGEFVVTNRLPFR